MRRAMIIAVLLASCSAQAAAQLRVPTIIQRVIPATRPGGMAPPSGIDALRGDFQARAGASTVYFGLGSAILSPPAKATLAAQAGWLRQHPEVVVRIEGHGDSGDTRDHALAVGARRAEEVRGYLVLLGVPFGQLDATSMGKERPGSPRAATILVR